MEPIASGMDRMRRDITCRYGGTRMAIRQAGNATQIPIISHCSGLTSTRQLEANAISRYGTGYRLLCATAAVHMGSVPTWAEVYKRCGVSIEVREGSIRQTCRLWPTRRRGHLPRLGRP